MPQYLQLERGYSPLTVGLALLPWTMPIVAIAPRAGRLADRVGERTLIVAGLGVQAAAFTLLAAIATTTASYLQLLGPLLLAGIGSGLAFPTTASAALRAAPTTQLGPASGISATIQQLGGVLGVATAVAVFTGLGGYRSPRTFINGLGPALIALAGLAALGALAALATRPHPYPQDRPGRRGQVLNPTTATRARIASLTAADELPADLAENQLAIWMAQLGDHPRDNTPIGPAQPAPDDAPTIDRLAAYFGRTITIAKHQP